MPEPVTLKGIYVRFVHVDGPAVEPDDLLDALAYDLTMRNGKRQEVEVPHDGGESPASVYAIDYIDDREPS